LKYDAVESPTGPNNMYVTHSENANKNTSFLVEHVHYLFRNSKPGYNRPAKNRVDQIKSNFKYPMKNALMKTQIKTITLYNMFYYFVITNRVTTNRTLKSMKYFKAGRPGVNKFTSKYIATKLQLKTDD
jgi:hypothetical protein